nr:CTD nuclear envelope phosphatase 1 homolog [Tanacetum cinerariifolium]
MELGQTTIGDTEIGGRGGGGVWRRLMTWLSFLFQIFLQIISRATPSLTNYYSSSTTNEFEPLSVVELSESPPFSASVQIPTTAHHLDPSQKLTVYHIIVRAYLISAYLS